jgi:hypothetical protein
MAAHLFPGLALPRPPAKKRERRVKAKPPPSNYKGTAKDPLVKLRTVGNGSKAVSTSPDTSSEEESSASEEDSSDEEEELFDRIELVSLFSWCELSFTV